MTTRQQPKQPVAAFPLIRRLTPEHWHAAHTLTAALLRLSADGGRPRCSDPATRAFWTSSAVGERERAAAWCAGCPVIEACRQAGAFEHHGVWGGHDREGQPVPTVDGEAA